MKKDLHMKRIYIATLLTALTILPSAFAIGMLLENNIKANSKNIKSEISEVIPVKYLEIRKSLEKMYY